jgi:carbon storage regulator
MLVLARRPTESLQIGLDITVTVLGIHGNQVRLGITAPRAIVVDRAEVHARKQRESATPDSQSFPSEGTLESTSAAIFAGSAPATG